MQTVVFLVLVMAVGCAKSTEGAGRTKRSFGYELITYNLENMQESFSSLLQNLINTGNRTEQKLSDFKKDTDETNSRFSSLIQNLINTVNKSEQKLSDLKQDTDETNSRLLQRIAKLETLGSTLVQNQKSIQKEISNVSSLALDMKNFIKLSSINFCNMVTTSGVYHLAGFNKTVYCETDSFGGGWLVIQQRRGTFKFNRFWRDYRDGFGQVGNRTDFWLGLETIHQITKSARFELLVEMDSENNESGYARYLHFEVAGEDEKYKLNVGDYWGTVGDRLSKHNNMYFYTPDRDNNNKCAEKYTSGWWYTPYTDFCFDSHLNLNSLIYWRNWAENGRNSRMMIRVNRYT